MHRPVPHPTTRASPVSICLTDRGLCLQDRVPLVFLTAAEVDALLAALDQGPLGRPNYRRKLKWSARSST
jgi:hypothetical protein